MADGKRQVNVLFEEPLFKKLEKMVSDDVMDRSKFIKKLVIQEALRRQGKVISTQSIAQMLDGEDK